MNSFDQFRKIGIITQQDIPIPELRYLLTTWSTKVGIQFTRKYIYYYAHSREFCIKYGLTSPLDDYFSTLSESTRNFFQEPKEEVKLDHNFDRSGYVDLIDYISARRGLLIYVVHNATPFILDDLIPYTRSLDLATIVTLATE